jgi:hypothetical protein
MTLHTPQKYLKSITPKSISELRKQYPVLSVNAVPDVHWCGHFLDPDFQTTIPDGADCCQWHWFGLPRRFGVRHPAYPWQEDIFADYFKKKQKLYYIGKPPKIGATLTWLKIAIHEAIKNPDWANGQVAIVVGTGGNEAEKMIDRAKEIMAYRDANDIPIRDENGNLITKLAIDEDYNNKKEFSINSVEFRAHPANNVDSIRSQPNMRLILVDEIGFFKMVEQQRVRDAFEHYIGGSDVIIVLITTAGHTPSGVGYDIETESPSIYKKYLYDYNIGLVVHPESMTSLYRKSDLDLIRDTPSWNRNYLRIWGHGSGNIFNSKIIDVISNRFYDFPDNISDFDNALAIDPAYGQVRDKMSSKYAAVGGWMENGIVHLRSWFELENPSDDEALTRVQREIDDIGYNNLVVDGHWTGIIKTFQQRGIASYGINYAQELVNMTDESERAVTDLKVMIHPTFEEIKGQLKAIRRNEKGTPNKKLSRFDCGDCFLQLIHHFKHGGIGAKLLKTKY